MMGTHQPQKDLFSYGVDLDRRVRQDHPLRAVAKKVDFSFVRDEVKGKYGRNGNVGLDPEIVLKLMFLLFWDNVKSERELMKILPEQESKRKEPHYPSAGSKQDQAPRRPAPVPAPPMPNPRSRPAPCAKTL